MKLPPRITHAIWDNLKTGRITHMSFGSARLRVEGESFVKEGASGRHTLNVQATNAARLDAHWQVFAGRNASEESIVFSPAGENRVEVSHSVYGPLFSITEEIENGQSVCLRVNDDSFEVPGLAPHPAEFYSRAAVKLYAALLAQTLEDTGH